MNYYKCKCGAHEGWNSGMPIPKCAWCKKCETTPAYSPEGHKTERPFHLMVQHEVKTDEGPKILSRCRYCMKTLEQLGPDERIEIEAAAKKVDI